jgi:hypothetical protein
MRRLAVPLLILVPCIAFSFPPPSFDSGASHIANRLHHHLYSRTMQEGKVYDAESLEPFMLQTSHFLTEGESHRKALALLDELLATPAEKLPADPLRRAMLQRDLWAVFAITTGAPRQDALEDARGRVSRTERFFDRDDFDLERIPQRRELQRRLARAMRTVALTGDEIKALPDNLDAAVRAKTFATELDPRQPGRTFLPPDLFAADGPWVPIAGPQREDGLAAPQHLAFSKGRSVFIAFLRLPKGRAATLAFIAEVDAAAQKKKKLPTLPDNAQLALVRRMLLIDRTGRVHESPITESVELRVPHPNDGGLGYAFHMHRNDLFAGRNGGLHAIGPDELTYFDFQGLRSATLGGRPV